MAKSKICRIVGESILKIGQPIEHDAETSTTATIDIVSYVSSGSFTFSSEAIDNTGQNVKKSMQYGQDNVACTMEFFAVDDDDPNNPLNIIKVAHANKQAIPIFFKEADTDYADGYDGDMIIETYDIPVPESAEVKVSCTLHPTTVYRIWKRLAEELTSVP